MIDYVYEPDRPSSLARVLARRGYRPDTIEAAIANTFDSRISRDQIKQICSEAANVAVPYEGLEAVAGLMKADEIYRYQMEQANKIFVERLELERAGSFG